MLNISGLQNIERKMQAMQNEINILKNASNLRVNNARIPFDNVDVHDKITWDKTVFMIKNNSQYVTTNAATLLFTSTPIIDTDFYSVSSSILTFKVAGRYSIGYSIGAYRSAASNCWMMAYPYGTGQLAYGHISLHGSANGLLSSGSTVIILDVVAGYTLKIVVDSTANSYVIGGNYCNFWARKLKPGDIQ